MIGILSDAHGNGRSFHAAITLLENLGAKELIFLGDAVGYIPTTDVVDALLEIRDRVTCIRGNHEAMLLGLQERSQQSETVYRLDDVRRKLTPEQIEFLTSWPTHMRVERKESNMLFVHGSPRDFTNGYVYPDTDLRGVASREDWIFMGHSHRPFVREFDQSTYVNVGSCGLPRDDGRYGCCALFDPVQQSVELYRFDIRDHIVALIEEGLCIHDSVTSLFARRDENIVGNVLVQG